MSRMGLINSSLPEQLQPPEAEKASRWVRWLAAFPYPASFLLSSHYLTKKMAR